MSKLNIGDRVVFNATLPSERGRQAVVVNIDATDLFEIQVRMSDNGSLGLCHPHEVEVVPRRRVSLARTGGKARFTVRQGQTIRTPKTWEPLRFRVGSGDLIEDPW